VANNGLPPSISLTTAAAGYPVTSALILTPTYGNSKTGDIVTLAPGSAPLPPGMSIVKNASGLYDLSKAAGTNDDVGGYGGIKLRVTDKGGLYSETAPFAIVYTSNPLLAYSNMTFTVRTGEPVSAVPVVSAGKATADLNFAFQTDVTGGLLKIDPATGALSGKVNASGTNTVVVTESFAGRTIRTFTYNVAFTANPLTVSAADVPAIVGTPISGVSATVTNGQSGGTWSMTGAPAWFTINPATGAFSGTPDAAGDYQVTVTFTDVWGSASKVIALNASAGAKGYKFVKIVDATASMYAYHRVDEVSLFDDKNVNVTSLGTIYTAPWPSNWDLALDGNLGTGFGIYPEAVNSYTVVLQFPSPVNFARATMVGAIGEYYGYSATQSQLAFQVLGSDDGQTWVELGKGQGPLTLKQKP
jgi:hypothetical protein